MSRELRTYLAIVYLMIGMGVALAADAQTQYRNGPIRFVVFTATWPCIVSARLFYLYANTRTNAISPARLPGS